MNGLSLGKIRGLQQLANPKGILVMLAVDHRDSLKKAINQENPEAVSYQEMVDFKLDLCRTVGPFASAILLDPVYGAAQAIAAGVLPGHAGLLVSMEKTGYTGEKTNRLTNLLPGWNVKKAKRLGASAIKLLLYYRPDLKDVAARQRDLVAKLADQCSKEDIPLLVEPVSYPVEAVGVSLKKFADMKPGLVIETAREITALPIDVLKAEFPADIDFEPDEARLLKLCQELNEASRLPWVLLSAGVDFERFKKQVEIACRAGASGFLAGRALWQEAPQIRSRTERIKFLETVSAQRLRELSDIAETCGTPWFNKLGVKKGEFGPVAEGWYKNY